VDVALQRVVATIAVGKRPRGIRFSPDGGLLYVALSGSPLAPPGVDESKLPPPDKKADGIGVVSVADLKLLRVLPGGSDPEQAALTLDGKQLFVANEDTGKVTALSTDDGKVLATFDVGEEPEGVDLRPDGKVVYVTSEEASQVAVIDVPGLKLLTTFKVGPRPRSTGFLPDSSRAYVSSENGGSLAVIDARTHKVLSTIQLTGELTRPMGVVASPDGSRVFVSTGRGKNVVVIDTATNKPIASIEVGDRPWGIAVSSDGKTFSPPTVRRTTSPSWTSPRARCGPASRPDSGPGASCSCHETAGRERAMARARGYVDLVPETDIVSAWTSRPRSSNGGRHAITRRRRRHAPGKWTLRQSWAT
jgi:YVTN family beta-propeller protein